MKDEAASPSFAGLPFELSGREIRLTAIGWGLFVLGQSIYCLVYSRVVAGAAFDFAELIVWALSEWGIWLAITPLLLGAMRRYEEWLGNRFWRFARLAMCALAASLFVRVCIEAFRSELSLAASAMVYFPRHLGAVAAIFLIWRFFLRASVPFNAERTERSAELESGLVESEAPIAAPETLLVSKGRDECLIRVDRIQYLSASGNYVEICCDGQRYMMRTTLKQLAERLPKSVFLRVHRSHLVHIDEIERIVARPSGNGLLRLRCGKSLSISRRYKADLQKHRA